MTTLYFHQIELDKTRNISRHISLCIKRLAKWKSSLECFLSTEQAGTDICWMIYQDINFVFLCLSLFGWKEDILHKQHIVQRSVRSIGGGKIEIRSLLFIPICLLFIFLSAWLPFFYPCKIELWRKLGLNKFYLTAKNCLWCESLLPLISQKFWSSLRPADRSDLPMIGFSSLALRNLGSPKDSHVKGNLAS